MQAMSFKNDFVVTGAKPSSGSFTNDKGEMVSYDTCNFYVQMPLKDGKGFASVEYKFGKSAEFNTLFPVELPAMATIEFEQLTTGKGRVQTNIVGIEFSKTKTDKGVLS